MAMLSTSAAVAARDSRTIMRGASDLGFVPAGVRRIGGGTSFCLSQLRDSVMARMPRINSQASEKGRSTIFGRILTGCPFQSWQLTACKDEINRARNKGHCWAALPDDAPFALAIGASILSTLVLPVSAEQEDRKDESVFGTDDVLSGAMQIISFIPLFNWLVWVFAWLDTRQPRYLVFFAIYLAPYLKTGLSLSPEDSWLPIASIVAGIVHVQLDISVKTEGQSPLGENSKLLLEKTQIKDRSVQAGGLVSRLKELTEKSDSRPMETTNEEDDQRNVAEWKAIQEKARKNEFAEWDEKLSRSKSVEETAKEMDS